jgi:hypothetical protein
MVVVLLSVLIGVVVYVGTTTPDSPAEKHHPWIQSFESDVCSAYNVNHYGETIFRNCP